jgi:hypothetical protein
MTSGAAPLSFDEFESTGASFVIAELPGWRLHKVTGGPNQSAAESSIHRQPGTADSINHHTCRVRRIPNFKLEFEIKRNIAEGRSF